MRRGCREVRGIGLAGLSLALLSAAACGPRRSAEGYDPNAVRMCIENETVGYGNVVAQVQTVRFTVYPGADHRRRVAGADAVLLRASGRDLLLALARDQRAGAGRGVVRPGRGILRRAAGAVRPSATGAAAGRRGPR